MNNKIYCVEGPDESSLFDDPEKGYENEDEIDNKEESPAINPDDTDLDIDNEDEHDLTNEDM